jgi:uncharacterized YigZ family protein
MDRYLIPVKQQHFEIDIKRSRFITTVVPVPNKTSALRKIDSIRQEYTDANHHCWAMVAGNPTDPHQQDQCDDGEPKGTAGKPMLNVLQHSGMGNLVVIVTRYFGGIKLGAGGLVRAYTLSVSSALAQIETATQFIMQRWQMTLPYSQLATFEHWLKSSNIVTVDRAFSDSVTLQLDIPESELSSLTDKADELGGFLVRME